MTKFFYDTEFHEDGRTIDLISIGIRADTGEEYYAVNADADYLRMEGHEFLCTQVIPHLPLVDGVTPLQHLGRWRFAVDTRHETVKPKSVIAREVQEFLTAYSTDWKDNELWAWYGAYDHVALAQLWGPMISLPKGIPMFTRELAQLWLASGRPEKPPKPEDAHSALADARWNLAMYQTCVGGAW